jgi:glycosyltransferase involved in cell wall biosynthesis
MKSDLIILIAHYNNPKGLEDSILSIKEPFSVDLIIVDDGSTIKFDENYIKSVYTNGKIFFEYLNKNSGVGVAANKGLKKIEELNYLLIGRLDCGDLCYENKYKKQLKYLSDNPKV